MKAKTNTKHINKSKLAKNRVIKNIKHVIKLAVFPHKKNNYRPHLVRHYGIAIIIVFVIGLQFCSNIIQTGSVLGAVSDISIRSLLTKTNNARLSDGYNPLIVNERLNKAAYLKAQDMLSDQYWAHDAPDGTKPWKWFADVDYSYASAGENLAKDFSTTNAVMTAWLNSPEHRANILNNDYKDVGFAIVSGELNNQQTTLIVAMYGLSADDSLSDNKIFSSSDGGGNIITQFAIISQSITPVTIVGLVTIGIAIVVAILAHLYRNKLPKKIQKTWLRHSGLIKAIGLIIFGIAIVFIYCGGQI